MTTKQRPITLKVEYRGYGTDLDREVEKSVGRRRDGSGFSFYDGTRDMSWYFARRQSAVAAGKRALKVLRANRGAGARAAVYPLAGLNIVTVRKRPARKQATTPTRKRRSP